VISGDTVLPATPTAITSSTITVFPPSGNQVTTYYITVTTAGGTSQYLPIFTY
jgi:hypothetical protein